MWEVSSVGPGVGEGWEAVTKPLGIKPLRGPRRRGGRRKQRGQSETETGTEAVEIDLRFWARGQ